MRNIVTVLFLMTFSIGIYAQPTPAPELSPYSGQVTEMYKGFVILNTADAYLEDRLDSLTDGSVITTFPAETVVITDNESTAENNPIVFVAGAAQAGGNLGLETDGTAYYTPNTGTITATAFAGDLTGTVTGEASLNVVLADSSGNDVAGTYVTGSDNIAELLTVTHNADVRVLYTLNIGWGNTSEDSIYFINGYFYDGSYNSGGTAQTITELACAVAVGDELSGSTTIQVDLDWDVNMNDGTPTQLNNTPVAVTSTTTGDIDTSFDNAGIPVDSWVWWRVTTTEGRFPSKLVCTASGYVAN